MTPQNRGSFELWKSVRGEKRPVLQFTYYAFGDPPHWLVYRVTHHLSGTSSHTLVYQGQIPNDAFARQLIKNVL